MKRPRRTATTPTPRSSDKKKIALLTRELTEAREQQTASGYILRAISGASDLQPVFDAIVASAVRLCGARMGAVFRFDGQLLHLVAHHNYTPEVLEVLRRTNPRPPLPDRASGRSILTRAVAQVEDALADKDYDQEFVHASNWRSLLAVPMLHAGAPIGTIVINRDVAGPFAAAHVELLKTFADQAVIAIENARLLADLRQRTADLTESLQQQTAASEVLSVISSSPGELMPVFEAILANATRLCEAKFGILNLYESEGFRTVALHNTPPAYAEWRQRQPPVSHPGPTTALGRIARTRQVVHTADISVDPAYVERDPLRVATVELLGARTHLAVPMLKIDELVGVITIYRQEVRPFTEKQIELVRNFAAQAVIAIENARLFEEVQARNRDLTALGEVGRAVSSTLDLNVVLKTIVHRALELSGSEASLIFYFRKDTGRFELGETTGLDEQAIEIFRRLDIGESETGLGEAITSRQPVHVSDVTKRTSNALRNAALEVGMRAALIVPLLSVEGPLGALVLQRQKPGEFPPAVISLMQSFADQSAIALENARLFDEIAQKSRELEIASEHKSQFVANMSHELRTPLAAILGYAELMEEGIYEPLGEPSLAALARIRSNGKHLLGLINTVLDIAKIESGQFALNMTEYSIEGVVETVRAATESLAQNKKLALATEVAKSLPTGLGDDEQRLTQVLLNLVGNAIKFTDTGEVRVTANAVNGRFAVSVVDTGPGIPEHERTKIFEEFHQVDDANMKAKGGTGLGLAIAKQIIEMHGGRIWVDSTVGKGSTFQMELPVRVER